MGGATGAVRVDASATRSLSALSELALCRIAPEGGATRSEIAKDIGNLVAHRLSPSEFRQALDQALSMLAAEQRVQVSRGRYRMEPAGNQLLAEILGPRALPDNWQAIRDTRLIARALGYDCEPARLKALDRPDGLRASILQKAYGIKGKRVPASSRLRMALAVVALERAFGNKIKSGLDAGRGLSVKASRLLAGQLAQRPRDFGTDARLISALAAEAVGAAQADVGALRQAILRRQFSQQSGEAPNQSAPARDTARRAAQEPKRARISSAPPPQPAKPPAANRPDLQGFVNEVLAQAARHAEGWPGNRKAFISDVWVAISEAHPSWGLSEIEFKSMLTEAHRTGHLVLANADIKNKENLRAVQASAVSYKNTVWHFVRVEN